MSKFTFGGVTIDPEYDTDLGLLQLSVEDWVAEELLDYVEWDKSEYGIFEMFSGGTHSILNNTGEWEYIGYTVVEDLGIVYSPYQWNRLPTTNLLRYRDGLGVNIEWQHNSYYPLWYKLGVYKGTTFIRRSRARNPLALRRYYPREWWNIVWS